MQKILYNDKIHWLMEVKLYFKMYMAMYSMVSISKCGVQLFLHSRSNKLALNEKEMCSFYSFPCFFFGVLEDIILR